MVKQDYQIEISNEKHIAKAILKNQPISTKFSVELARELKGKRVDKAERFLKEVMTMESFLPLRKYRKKVGHRRGNSVSSVKTGRYPIKAAKVFLGLLDTVKANADYKGLDSENLIITHLFASMGFRRISHQHQGRISGKMRRKKATHIEIVVREAK